jgi:aldose 1-epimerase
MKILVEKFAELHGQTVNAYTMVNDRGMEVTTLNYGCIITKILVPDRNGVMENVVLGFDTLEDYQTHSPYFGTIVGRYAGRIAGGKYSLDGETIQLTVNSNGNHQHGGFKGFDKMIWEAEAVEKSEEASLVFTYFSPDGEEGYPGNLNMKVTYTLTNENELIIICEGVSDKKTVVNLTNHSYFNLSGDLKRDILGHSLMIKSDQFLPLNDRMIPTGELAAVDDTVFDLRSGRKLSEGIKSSDPQIEVVGNGYDHPFLLAENENQEISLYDDASGRGLIVETNQPAVVVYSSNHLATNYSIRGVQSRPYLGVCLETQFPPDSVNHPHLPQAVIEKDELYKAVTRYKFTN